MGVKPIGSTVTLVALTVAFGAFALVARQLRDNLYSDGR